MRLCAHDPAALRHACAARGQAADPRRRRAGDRLKKIIPKLCQMLPSTKVRRRLAALIALPRIALPSRRFGGGLPSSARR